MQRQTTVTEYFSSKQLLLFVFARRSVCQYWMAEDNPAAQRQTAVTIICLKTSAVPMMTQYVAAGVATRTPLSARLYKLNVHPLEVLLPILLRENYLYLFNLRPNIFKS